MLLPSPRQALVLTAATILIVSSSLITPSSAIIPSNSEHENEIQGDLSDKLISEDHRHLAYCPRERSRVVRGFLNNHVYPLLSLDATQLPGNCALNPNFDPYRDQEKNKESLGRGEWRCLYCSKLFKSEHYLDKHMHNKHTNKLSNATSSGCLGHICPIFGCDADDTSSRINTFNDGGGGSGGGGGNSASGVPTKDFSSIKKSCNADNIEKLLFSCDLLMRRCFKGVVNSNGVDSYTYFKEKICGKLHCTAGKLQGSIPDPVEEYYAVSYIKYVIIALAIIFILGYIIFNNIIPLLLFDKSGRLQANVLSRRIEEKSKQRQQQQLQAKEGSGFWSSLFGRSSKKVT